MQTRLPSTKDMQAFIMTSKHLKFTLAAEALNVTQGAVSRQILGLEKKLNVTLFHRHARGLSLTEQGREFLPLAQKIIDDLQSAVEKVSAIKPVIRLKAPSCITTWLLPKIMAYQRAFSEQKVELTSSIEHDVKLSSGDFDAIICYAEVINDSSLIQQKLFDEYLTPVCCASFLPEGRSQLTISEMSDFPWLHSTPKQSDWALWLEEAQGHLSSSKHNQHFATLDLAVSAAKEGFGISIGDVMLASLDVNAGRLVMPHSLQVKSGKAYYFLYAATSKKQGLEALMNWLLEH